MPLDTYSCECEQDIRVCAAPRGTYTDQDGKTAPTLCPQGTYNDQVRQTS